MSPASSHSHGKGKKTKNKPKSATNPAAATTSSSLTTTTRPTLVGDASTNPRYENMSSKSNTEFLRKKISEFFTPEPPQTISAYATKVKPATEAFPASIDEGDDFIESNTAGYLAPTNP